jgi:hypothetical protein
MTEGSNTEVEEIHIEELHNLLSSPNIIRVMKSKRVRWAGHVESTGRQ